MKYITHANYYEINGKIWAINSQPSGCYTHQLKQFISQLDNMLEHHSKVLVIRFDLHLKEFTETNKLISDFNRQFFRRLNAIYKFTRIGFIWVREIEKEEWQHYHYTLLLDGNKVNHSARIANIVENLWPQYGSNYWLPVNPYHFIKRGDHQTQQEAIYRISYLAKGRGKGYRPPQTKDYGTSRIKPLAKPCNEIVKKDKNPDFIHITSTNKLGVS